MQATKGMVQGATPFPSPPTPSPTTALPHQHQPPTTMKLATFSLVSMCASTLMLLAFIAVTEGKKPGVSDVSQLI